MSFVKDSPTPGTGQGPASTYQRLIDSGEFAQDPAQQRAIAALDRVYQGLVSADDKGQGGILSRLFGKSERTPIPVQGLYLWGGVGRGKTWMMDVFYDAIPFEEKRRVHFHRYMRNVHNELKKLSNQSDPLKVIGEAQARNMRVLCFDEFVVEDIGDAMLLSGLLKTLFDNGVTLVATSNTEPKDLYKDGLQKARFQPAIDLIEKHTEVMFMDPGLDFRLRALDTEGVYHVPADDNAFSALANSFDTIASHNVNENASVSVLGRDINYIRKADGVVWFRFEDICQGPRSNADYIEIAKEFHTVLVSGVPIMNNIRNDEARRFIEMIDEFYDRNINFIVSADAGPTELYSGTRLTKPFERTTSRLIEMQSREYLAREKRVVS